jgi:hypothetical protein
MSAAIAALLLAAGTPATDAFLDQSRARWEGVASQIWEFSEPSLQETKSANLTAELLEKEGFKVSRNVGGMATAFVATVGSGSPVVGILAEYDALPGLSQQAGEAHKAPRGMVAATIFSARPPSPRPWPRTTPASIRSFPAPSRSSARLPRRS